MAGYIGNEPNFQNFARQYANGGAASYALDFTPGSENAVLVIVDGVTQKPTTDYTVSGSTLTPVTAFPAGALNVTIIFLGVRGDVATPSNATIEYAMLTSQAQGALAPYRNRLINPTGAVYQRVVASTADDVYFADRWNMLTQTAAVTPSVLTDPEDGHPKGVRITQVQAAAQRFGFSQIIEGRQCKDLRGKSGVLVPRVRISNSQAVRYAVLGWTGTEDAVTSDVVNDWTSASYTAGGFFNATTLSVLAVGAQTPSANTWTSLAALSGALGSAFHNIVVMVWTEGTAAQNVTLDFDYVQFERGTVATEFERRSYGDELRDCQRYAWVWNDDGVSGAYFPHSGPAYNTSDAIFGCEHPVRMRATPTMTPSAVGDFGLTTGSAGGTVDSLIFEQGNAFGGRLNASTSTTPFTANDAVLLNAGNVNARMVFSAEL